MLVMFLELDQHVFEVSGHSGIGQHTFPKNQVLNKIDNLRKEDDFTGLTGWAHAN